MNSPYSPTRRFCHHPYHLHRFPRTATHERQNVKRINVSTTPRSPSLEPRVLTIPTATPTTDHHPDPNVFYSTTLTYPRRRFSTHDNTHSLPKTTLTSPLQASLTNSTELGEYKWLGIMKEESKRLTNSRTQKNPSKSTKRHMHVSDLNAGSPMLNLPSDMS